jgi:Raf kinase inhibitor-like YbhB/YbcL family protein
MACKCLLIGGIFVITMLFVLSKYAGKKSSCPCCCSHEASHCAPIGLKSNAFEANAPIASKYAYDQENISPSLSWNNIPSGTKSIVLIVDDPDAPREKPWVHWIMYNIPATQMELAENIPALETLENGAKQGVNDWDKIGYGGPCPPVGHGIHHYHFKLYALKEILDVPEKPTKDIIENAMQGKILGYAELVGTYIRE